MLTLKKLKDMLPNEIIAKGEGYIRHPWFSKTTYKSKKGAYKTVTPSGLTKVKWIAVRGGIHDWAIYHSLDSDFCQADYLDDPIHLETPYESILSWGAKLHEEDEIKKLVPCDDDAFFMYRH